MKIFQHLIIICVVMTLAVSALVDIRKVEAVKNIAAVSSAVLYGTSTPQFVLLSFDGSKSIDMWRQTREFAKQMNEKGKPLHFTYFINSIYFLTEQNKDAYTSPLGVVGDSRIGFANSEEDVALRVNEIKNAIDEGNEIGSHTAGHFMGINWSEEEWKKEFSSFKDLISNAQKNNSHVKIPDTSFLNEKIVGFRAPELGVNDALYKTLKESNFIYDASGVGFPDTFPKKDEYGIWHIPLNTIEIGKDKSSAIAMDYSLWMHQSQGMNLAKKGTGLWDEYFKDVKDSYLEYFNRNYKHKRAPVVIGHHFSLWNDGVYWEAMKSFAEDVCGMKDVRCVTFGEYTKYLEYKNSLPLVKKQ